MNIEFIIYRVLYLLVFVGLFLVFVFGICMFFCWWLISGGVVINYGYGLDIFMEGD